MPKLSDVFLNILGNALQGEQGTPAAREERAIRLAQNARANLATLADLNQNYNQLSPGFIGPKDQGSFTPDSNTASLTGLVPGTTLQPISRTATTPFITPGKTPGSAQVNYASRPLQRGEVTEPSINTVSPYNTLMLGSQKNILDQANSYRAAANAALAQFTNMASKEDPSVISSFMQGVMPSMASFKDKAVAAAAPQLFSIYKKNNDQADQLSSQGVSMSPMGTRPPPNPMLGAGAVPAGGNAPTLGTVKIQGSDGRQWNIPAPALQAARLRDPNLQVVQ